MQLFFQEKFFSGKMVITDMEEKPIYTGKRSSWTGTIKLTDANKKKIATIIEKNGLFNKGFTIKIGRKKVAKIKRKLSLLNQKFHVKKLEWDITGNFVSKEYTIKKGEELIATIKRDKLISLTEGYTVDVTNPEDAVCVICVVLVLNTILRRQKGKIFKK